MTDADTRLDEIADVDPLDRPLSRDDALLLAGHFVDLLLSMHLLNVYQHKEAHAALVGMETMWSAER